MYSTRMIQVLSWLALLTYCLLVYLFFNVYLMKGGFASQLKDLEELKGAFTISIRQLLLYLSIVVTLVATFISYGIGKFFLLFFTEESRVYLLNVLFSKICTVLVNLVLVLLFSIIDVHVFSIVSLLGVCFLFFMVFKQNKSIMTPILFTLPFFVDVALSLFR